MNAIFWLSLHMIKHHISFICNLNHIKESHNNMAYDL